MIVGGAMIATAGLAWARTPRVREAAIEGGDLEEIVPRAIGPWRFETRSGLVLPPPDQLSASIYDTILTRVYSAPNDLPVMLLIAYGGTQNGMLQIHRPEFCYPASGFRLTDPVPVAITLGPGEIVPSRYFSAEAPNRTEQLIYWTRIAREFPASWMEQRMAVIRSNLAGVIPDGVLVRLSTIGTEPDRAIAALSRFASDLLRASDARGRALLLGTAPK